MEQRKNVAEVFKVTSSPRMDRGWWEMEAVPLSHLERNEKMMLEIGRIRMEAFTDASSEREKELLPLVFHSLWLKNSLNCFPLATHLWESKITQLFAKRTTTPPTHNGSNSIRVSASL